MKKGAILLFGLAFGSLCLLPAFVSIADASRPLQPVGKFHPLPEGVQFVRGIAHDGTHLFILAYESTGPVIFQVDPATETLVDKFVWTLSPRPDHLAWDGRFYYVVDTTEQQVYVIDTHFALQRRLPLPDVETQGLCIDGRGRLLVVTPSNREILVLDPESGDPQGTIPVPVPSLRRGTRDPEQLMSAGVAFDGENLWHSMVREDGTGELMQMSMTGELMMQFSLSDYITSLTFNFGAQDFLWATTSSYMDSVVVQYEPFAPLLPWADIWGEPNPVHVGGPMELHATFYNTDPIVSQPFVGVFGLGLMFEYQWEYYPIYWVPMYIPAESSYEDVVVLSLDSYPYLPSHYFVSVLLNADFLLVSYDVEDMDDAE